MSTRVTVYTLIYNTLFPFPELEQRLLQKRGKHSILFMHSHFLAHGADIQLICIYRILFIFLSRLKPAEGPLEETV